MVNGDGGTSQPLVDVLQALNPLIQPIADPVGKCTG